jgi:hypothetical protein
LELKIKIPENISDITLEQFVAYEMLRDSKELDSFVEKSINIFTGLDLSLMGDIPVKEKESIFLQCMTALDVSPEFTNRFTIDGVEFGFVPNIDTMNGDEYTDAVRYSDSKDNMHRLMAVLFRPIKKDGKFGNYSIVKYTGTSEYAELMKRTPMNIVNGCLGFFLTLLHDLKNHSQTYMSQEQVKEKSH